jgi:hypothetical protein
VSKIHEFSLPAPYPDLIDLKGHAHTIMTIKTKLNVFAATVALTLGVCALVSTGSAQAAGKASRDWSKFPAVTELTTGEDIYAIGDPHGDPERLAGVLLAAKLIASVPGTPAQAKWAGGKAVLVVTGDLIDKWTDSLQVIALLRALQADAPSHGGQVLISMGNHEAEFLSDPLGKKTLEFSAELKAAGLDATDTANCKGDLGQFLCQLPVAVRVNDWFFSHGGNSNKQTIAELNASIAAGFAKDGFATTELVGDNSILEARLNKKGPGGLPWFQDGSSKTDPQKLLTKYVGKLGVQHLVQGHQYGKVKFRDGKDRDEEDFFQRYGLLFLIDSGMSRGIEDSTSTGGALHISGSGNAQQAVIICANGSEQKIWDSKKNQDHKAQHCGK